MVKLNVPTGNSEMKYLALMVFARQMFTSMDPSFTETGFPNKKPLSNHTGLESSKGGLPGGKLKWNAGSKSSTYSSARTSPRTNGSNPEWSILQFQTSKSDSKQDESFSILSDLILLDDNGIHTNASIDETLSENASDLADALNEFSKDLESISNSNDTSNVQLFDSQDGLHCYPSPPTISCLIKHEMKLKIRCRRLHDGLPEMPDLQDNMPKTFELSDEEKQRQQLRLSRARQASNSYRRKFKSRETQLSEAFKSELQTRTKLQQEVNILKQKKDILNKTLQCHSCKHVSK